MDEENNQDLMEEVDPNRKTKEFVEQKNNTKIKTKSDVNKFKAWLIKKKDQRN